MKITLLREALQKLSEDFETSLEYDEKTLEQTYSIKNEVVPVDLNDKKDHDTIDEIVQKFESNCGIDSSMPNYFDLIDKWKYVSALYYRITRKRIIKKLIDKFGLLLEFLKIINTSKDYQVKNDILN
jgi:hypothetical protein